MKKEVTDDYLPWVSQYLVMKRASIEPNFHTLYANFTDALGMAKLTTMVTKETFRNIKVSKRYLVMKCNCRAELPHPLRQLHRRPGHGKTNNDSYQGNIQKYQGKVLLSSPTFTRSKPTSPTLLAWQS